MLSPDSPTSESQLGGFFRFVAGLEGETCNERERGFDDGAGWRMLEEAQPEPVCRVRYRAVLGSFCGL